MTPKARATELAATLFTNGNQQTAERLKLVDAKGRDLGGWGVQPIIDRIEAAIIAAIEEERAACAAIAGRYENEEAEAARMFGRNKQPVQQATHAVMSIICGRIRDEIRARSQS